MVRPAPVVRREGAGWLEPLRLGVRWREGGRAVFGEARLAPGRVAVGPWRLGVAVDAAGESACFDLDARNTGAEVLELESLVLGLRWRGVDTSAVRFLRHGWQSWSVTEGRALDDPGEPPFPSGPWLRGMWHALGAPPPDRAGWHESDLLSVARSADGGACCVGALERGEGLGVVYLRREPEAVRVEAEVFLQVPVAPGGARSGETLRVALGGDPQALLEEHAAEHGRRGGARTAARLRTGWCTWYQFFHDLGEDDVLRNLEHLAARRDEIPVDLVQIDDGYQRAVGDWLETSPRFPRGLAPLARQIRDAGFEAGLWTAPFCVVPESRLFRERPEWLLRQAGGLLFRGLLHPEWSAEGAVHVLDASLAPVREHLTALFRELVALGFTYHKLDFLYTQAMAAESADPALSRAARLRRGLEAIRSGAGEDAFLLGCGCPLGPAVGVVDGMRIGPDVAPAWAPQMPVEILGLAPTAPSTRNAVRNVLNRAWMHRRLWLNDPDCLMARSTSTALSRAEADTLAAAIAATGGLAVVSDDLPVLDAEARRLLRETFARARRVDAGGAAGTARALGFLEEAIPTGVTARTLGGALMAAVNATDAPVERSVDLAAQGLPPAPEGPRWTVKLEPHASALRFLRGPGRLAVFCDMDGTLIRQDVGATLARRHAGPRRPAVWDRYERGEISAWDYNLDVLDGLALPEEELEAYLRTVELDPGARDLVAWCAARDVPFRVLSDGFDRNIERLQELHGLRFDYEANHLRYEDGCWRIAARHPNPGCPCGTGTCKAGRIDAWRASHPGAVVVHIGNGRVSDLCGALAADLAFAKDSLAEELARRGLRYEPFSDLHDVVAGLERLWDGEGGSATEP